MPLPAFNELGDLPVGLHKAPLVEVLARFGAGSEARQTATTVLQRIYQLVTATGKLDRFVLFGSYLTAKADPHNIDVVLVMKDDFSMKACDEQTRVSSTTSGQETRSGPASSGSVPAPCCAGRWRTFSWGGGPSGI